jgi:hypothetical protein
MSTNELNITPVVELSETIAIVDMAYEWIDFTG